MNQLLALSFPPLSPVSAFPVTPLLPADAGPPSTCLLGHPTGPIGSFPGLQPFTPALLPAGLACAPGHRSVLASSSWLGSSASREGVPGALLCLPAMPSSACSFVTELSHPVSGLLPLVMVQPCGPACDPGSWLWLSLCSSPMNPRGAYACHHTAAAAACVLRLALQTPNPRSTAPRASLGLRC